MPPEERRRVILAAAMRVFIEKGYMACTMQDIVQASGLSVGGFYHHYRSKAELMHDIIERGAAYRSDLVLSYRDSHPELSRNELTLDFLMAKMLDENDWKTIYTMFLQEIRDDSALQSLYERIMLKSRRAFDDFCRDNGLKELQSFNSELFIALLNCIYLGIDILKLRPVLLRHQNTLKKMLLVLKEEQEDETYA